MLRSPKSIVAVRPERLNRPASVINATRGMTSVTGTERVAKRSPSFDVASTFKFWV